MPLINAEIWNSESLQETYKSNDKLFYKNQMLITKAMIPIIHIMNNCIEKKSQNDTFDLACDAFQLLAYAHRDASNLRRHMLKPSISKEYRKLCNPATPITQNLFGDDLHKQIKDLNETRKLTCDFSVTRPKRKLLYSQHQAYKRSRHSQKDTNRKSFFGQKAPTFSEEIKESRSGPKTVKKTNETIISKEINVSTFPIISLKNNPDNFVAGQITKKFHAWVNITSDKWILDIVRYGYDIEFELSPPEKISKYEINFNEKEKCIVSSEVEKMLSNKVIRIISEKDVKFVSTIFLRPKRDGNHRFVN